MPRDEYQNKRGVQEQVWGGTFWLCCSCVVWFFLILGLIIKHWSKIKYLHILNCLSEYLSLLGDKYLFLLLCMWRHLWACMQAWTHKESLPIANAKCLWERRLVFLIITTKHWTMCFKWNLFVKFSLIILQTWTNQPSTLTLHTLVTNSELKFFSLTRGPQLLGWILQSSSGLRSSFPWYPRTGDAV